MKKSIFLIILIQSIYSIDIREKIISGAKWIGSKTKSEFFENKIDSLRTATLATITGLSLKLIKDILYFSRDLKKASTAKEFFSGKKISLFSIALLTSIIKFKPLLFIEMAPKSIREQRKQKDEKKAEEIKKAQEAKALMIETLKGSPKIINEKVVLGKEALSPDDFLKRINKDVMESLTFSDLNSLPEWIIEKLKPEQLNYIKEQEFIDAIDFVKKTAEKTKNLLGIKDNIQRGLRENKDKYLPISVEAFLKKEKKD